MQIETNLKYHTSDIRRNSVNRNAHSVLLETEKGVPSQRIGILRSQTKGGKGRAYYECPLCHKRVSILHYPYEGFYMSSGTWRCARCMVDSLCGGAIIEQDGQPCFKRTYVKMHDFRPSLAGNGYSYQRVTSHIIKRLERLATTPDDTQIASLNSPDIIDCPQIDADDSKTLGELQALYALRNRIIAGELPYSKAALTKALQEPNRPIPPKTKL